MAVLASARSQTGAWYGVLARRSGKVGECSGLTGRDQRIRILCDLCVVSASSALLSRSRRSRNGLPEKARGQRDETEEDHNLEGARKRDKATCFDRTPTEGAAAVEDLDGTLRSSDALVSLIEHNRTARRPASRALIADVQVQGLS